MRVKLLENEELRSCIVVEISEIGYDDDFTEVMDEDDYDEDECLSGLYMIDAEGNRLYIEGLSVSECNSICDSILRNGYCDLTSYGEYLYFDDEDDEYDD